MRAELFLAHKYIKGHKRQCIGIVLCVALFIAAFSTVLIYRESARVTIDKENAEQFGKDSGIVYRADPQKVEENKAAIANSGAGVLRAVSRVSAPGDKPVYMGSMDSAVLDLKAIHVQEGRLPENKTEAAIEQSTYNALGLHAAVNEQVTLPVLENGKVTGKTVTLVGILQDYVLKWQSIDGSKQSIPCPPPAVLVVPDSSKAEYINVVCADGSLQNTLGGRYVENAVDMQNPNLQSGKTSLDLFVVPILVFFVVVIIFGINSILSYTLQERKRYLGLLRCIGLTKRRGRRLFLLQGVELFLASSLVGTVLSFLLSFVIVSAFGLFGRQMVYAVTFFCFWPSYVVLALTLLLTFTIPLFRFFKKGPLETGKLRGKQKQRTKESYRSFPALWRTATKRNYAYQNVVAVLLAASCLFITVFGCFISIFAPRQDYNIMNKELGAEDYVLYVSGGSSGGDNFQITLPRKLGVSQQDLDMLRRTEELQVNYARVSSMTSHFLLLTKESRDPNLLSLIQQKRYLKPKETPQVKQAIAQAGGAEGDRLVEPRMNGMDYDTVQKTMRIKEGKLDKARFLAGEEVIAPDTYNIGDTYQLITPILADESAPQESERRFQFKIRNIRVAATYDASEGDYLVLSAEYIMATDPSARYDEVSISNRDENDAAAVKRVEELVSGIAAKSEYTSMRNYIDQRAQYYRSVRNGQIQTAVSVAVFILLVILAFMLSTYVKVRTNMRSYILMRALGAKDETVLSLLRRDAFRLITTGIVLGTAAGFAVLAWTTRNHFIQTWDIYLITGLVAAAAAILLYLLTALAIRKPVKLLFHSSVAEELNDIEL